MMNNFEKIAAVLSSESMQEAFGACTNEADAVKLLAENGVAVTEAELREVIMQAMKRVHAADGNNELSEDKLEQVAGGISWSDFWRGLKDIGEAISGMGVGGVNN